MKRLLPLLLTVLSATSMAQPQADHTKLSAHLSRLVANQATGTAAKSPTLPSSVLTLLTLTDRSDPAGTLAPYGARLVDSIGRIYIVRIPLHRVGALSMDARVERIEAERMPRQAMDVTPLQINATKVYAGDGLPQAFTGEGVAAGVFDCGFDFTHAAFLDTEGHTRARYYYDFLWPNADGTLGHALTTPEEIEAYGHSQHVNNSIHGTHVMGIMAGRAVDGKYQGMAPDAALYVADFNSRRSDFESPDAETSAVAVLGFKHIFDAAERDGRPCVVNFSNCESLTLTRQRQLEAEALLQLTGPGRIIVSAAGNDGFRSSFMEKPADVAQAGTGIVNGVFSGEVIDIDLVTPVNQQVRFDFMGMRLMGDGIEGTIIFQTDSIDTLQGDTCRLTTTVSLGEVELNVWRSDYDDPRGAVYHIDGRMPHLTYLVLYGATVLLSGEGPAWMYTDIYFSPFSNVQGVAAYSHAHEGYNVSWPSTLPGIIGVGATGYKGTVRNMYGELYTGMLQFAPDAEGHATLFSSRGPTFSGLTKPDVVAPGLNINAPYNSFVDVTDALRNEMTDCITLGGHDYYYTAQSGTSMASPVAAGTIALWLQAKPDLTPEEVLQVIAATSTHPDDALPYPNNTYGHGQIDAYAGLLHVLQLPSAIADLSRHQPAAARFRLEGRRLTVDYAAEEPQHTRLRVYDLKGHLVATGSAPVIDLQHLPAGVYAVQLNTDRQDTTGSTLIRL